jgi:hypothetical protein
MNRFKAKTKKQLIEARVARRNKNFMTVGSDFDKVDPKERMMALIYKGADERKQKMRKLMDQKRWGDRNQMIGGNQKHQNQIEDQTQIESQLLENDDSEMMTGDQFGLDDNEMMEIDNKVAKLADEEGERFMQEIRRQREKESAYTEWLEDRDGE